VLRQLEQQVPLHQECLELQELLRQQQVPQELQLHQQEQQLVQPQEVALLVLVELEAQQVDFLSK
jgi:hypothetical protein